MEPHLAILLGLPPVCNMRLIRQWLLYKTAHLLEKLEHNYFRSRSRAPSQEYVGKCAGDGTFDARDARFGS